MIYDITERVAELHKFYDELLDRKIEHISELSGVPAEKMIKINPAEFIEKNKFQHIEGYNYIKIGKWIADTKTPENYLISPLDDDARTANQIAYKEKVGTERIRASKCQIMPVHSEVALDFYSRNHRQSLPLVRDCAISFALVYHGEIVGCMTYDKSDGAVRGKSKKNYELSRLAFQHGLSIAGGASKLQKHCENALSLIGETQIFSYSNATINEGRVYAALGFEQGKVDDGQPFAILTNNKLERLVHLYPYTTAQKLAAFGNIKTHVGGNRLWIKKLDNYCERSVS